MQLRCLFLKDAQQAGLVVVEKIEGKRNCADIQTKPVDRATLARCMKEVPAWSTVEEEVHMITQDDQMDESIDRFEIVDEDRAFRRGVQCGACLTAVGISIVQWWRSWCQRRRRLAEQAAMAEEEEVLRRPLSDVSVADQVIWRGRVARRTMT